MAAPSTPTGFYVQQGNGDVYVACNLTATATSYVFYRSIDGISYSQIGNPTLPNYTDTTTVIGTQYYYKAAAKNADGTSSQTSAVQIVPANSGQMSLQECRLRAQQESDMQNSSFITTEEWNKYIIQSYFELYDLLTTAYEDYYVADPYIFQTTGSNTYNLPNGIDIQDVVTGLVAKKFYKVLGVDLGLSTGTNAWVTIPKFNFISRNRYVYPQLTSTYLGVFNLRYRVLEDRIMFIPTPSSGQYLRLWYIPALRQPLADTDILDGVSGWLEYVIVDSAIKAIVKEESDPSALMARKMALLKRIEDTSANRDAGAPDTISDSRSSSERWGTYGPPNGDGSYGGF